MGSASLTPSTKNPTEHCMSMLWKGVDLYMWTELIVKLNERAANNVLPSLQH